MRVGAIWPEYVECRAAAAHDKATARIDGHLVRENRTLAVVRDELEVERAVGVEDLDAVVFGIGHHDAAVECNVDIRWVAEFAVAVSGLGADLADLEVERAVGVEDLDAVVVIVGHHDAAVEGGDGDAARGSKLAVAISALAE